jgi:ribonuclease HI
MAAGAGKAKAARRPAAAAKQPPDPLLASFDGACEPVNPGGLGTYGFVVRQGDRLLVRRQGVVPDIAGVAMTGNIAEYVALLFLLEWLAANPTGPARIEGDSKLVVMQVRGEWDANVPILRMLRDKCRALLPKDARLVHVPRDKNGEADALTHLAYVEAFQADPALRRKHALALASPHQVDQCRKAGVPVYAFMGASEAERRLRKAKEKAKAAE